MCPRSYLAHLVGTSFIRPGKPGPVPVLPYAVCLSNYVDCTPSALCGEKLFYGVFFFFLQKTVYGANVVIFEGILAFANKELLKVRLCYFNLL